MEAERVSLAGGVPASAAPDEMSLMRRLNLSFVCF